MLRWAFVLLALASIAAGCHQDPNAPACRGSCTGSASYCYREGEGCQCIHGRWYGFYDGPCHPGYPDGGIPFDAGIRDTGADALTDADAPFSDADASSRDAEIDGSSG